MRDRINLLYYVILEKLLVLYISNMLPPIQAPRFFFFENVLVQYGRYHQVMTITSTLCTVEYGNPTIPSRPKFEVSTPQSQS